MFELVLNRGCPACDGRDTALVNGVVRPMPRRENDVTKTDREELSKNLNPMLRRNVGPMMLPRRTIAFIYLCTRDDLESG